MSIIENGTSQNEVTRPRGEISEASFVPLHFEIQAAKRALKRAGIAVKRQLAQTKAEDKNIIRTR